MTAEREDMGTPENWRVGRHCLTPRRDASSRGGKRRPTEPAGRDGGKRKAQGCPARGGWGVKEQNSPEGWRRQALGARGFRADMRGDIHDPQYGLEHRGVTEL